MKVKELIQILKSHDPNLKVLRDDLSKMNIPISVEKRLLNIAGKNIESTVSEYVLVID